MLDTKLELSKHLLNKWVNDEWMNGRMLAFYENENEVVFTSLLTQNYKF